MGGIVSGRLARPTSGSVGPAAVSHPETPALTCRQKLSSNCPVKSNRAATCYQIVEQKHHDRTGNRDKHTVEVQARNAFFPKKTEQISPDNRTYDSKRDVEPETLALSIDDLASDESRYQAKYDPAQDAHATLLVQHLSWLSLAGILFPGPLIQINVRMS